MNRGKRILSMFVALCLIATIAVYVPEVLAFGEEASPGDGTSGTNSTQDSGSLKRSASWNDIISNIVDINIPAANTSNQSPQTVIQGEIIPPPADTIGIYTAQDLSDMRNNLSGNYTLMNDIDMTAFTASGDGWIPVGTAAEPFTGILDGNGHAITGLRIYKYPQNTTSFVGGLFGYGTGMTVKNLTLSVDINTVAARAGRYLILGGIIGKADRVTLSGCTVTAKIKAKAETTDIGGLIGLATLYQQNETGGIVIENCTTTGEINTSGRAYDLGGIVGEAERLFVTNTVNHIKLYGLCTAPDKESTAAGIVGRFTSGAIKDTTNDGIITTDVSSVYMTNTSSAYAGGVAGLAVPVYSYSFPQKVGITGCLNKGAINSERMGTITQAGIVVKLGSGIIADNENQGDIRNFTAYEGGAFGIVADSGSADITRCINKADILCSSISAAGITDCPRSAVSQCSNWGTISSLKSAGGIAIINVKGHGTISNCLNAGEISGSLGSFQTIAGGIAAANNNSIQDCYNIGTIRGGAAGGIVGQNDEYGTVSNCLNAGSIFAAGSWDGAMVGINFGVVSNSYYEAGINPGCGVIFQAGRDESKGLGPTQLKTMESYVGFDFITDDTPAVWSMSTNTGWPKLNALEEVYVNGLTIIQNPKKISYLINEPVDTLGLILKATLSNGESQYLDTDYTLGSYTMAKGTRAIPVTYAGKSASFNASFLYFTVEINEYSLLNLDTIDFPGVFKMNYYTASTAAGPYSLWISSTPMDETDTSMITNDLTLNKTYYFKVQPIYPSGAGPVYGPSYIRFKPAMPEIQDFFRVDNGVQMNCMPTRYINGYEMYCSTSIGGPYTKIGESATNSMVCGGLKQGTFYFFVARTYINSNGIRVYSDYSPVQWGRFL